MKKVIIIGAGQIGSRHLQSLKKVAFPLDITIVDPSIQSLKIAQERFDEMPEGKYKHTLYIDRDIPNKDSFDLAIIATSSDIRAEVTYKFLAQNSVKYIVFEKMLFIDKKDYVLMSNILKKREIKAWVNCPMRMMPFYKDLKKKLGGSKIYYHVSAGMPVMVASAIHYIDHIASLIGTTEYEVDTRLLNSALPSKRKGFLELSGTLILKFSEGSLAVFTITPNQGTAPSISEIINDSYHYILRGHENKAWIAQAKNQWQWQEISAPFLLQSQLGTEVVNKVLKDGTSDLVRYQESSLLHFPLVTELTKFVNRNSKKKYNFYPFT